MNYNDELNLLRNEIEETDKEIAKLFEKRMLICKDIALLKKQNGVFVEDLSREKQLFEKNVFYIKNDGLKKYYSDFFKNIVTLSKLYQTTITDEK